MRPDFRIAGSAGLVLILLCPPGAARAQTTAWTNTDFGDWTEASNWTNGVPTAGVDVELDTSGSLLVTTGGAACRNLTSGISTPGSYLWIEGGALDVSQSLHVGSGASANLYIEGGSVSAPMLVLGSPGASGDAIMSGGSLSVESATLGATAPSSGGSMSMTVGDPSWTVSGSLHITELGSVGCAAGTLRVGSSPVDGIILDGQFTLDNNPVISTTGLTISSTALFTVGVGVSGISPIVVDGAARLGGQLLVTDIFAAAGTYEIIRAGSFQGAFDSVSLPDDWSWRIAGNSFLLTKGPVPVEATTWGRLKTAFAR